MKLRGEVFTGEGEAAEFLQVKPYKDFITRKLGVPFPGTLNLKVDPVKADSLKQASEFHRLEDFKYGGKDYGGMNFYLVRVEGLVAGIVEPDRTRYGSEIIELVAEKELRKEFNLKDGETLEIEPLSH